VKDLYIVIPNWGKFQHYKDRRPVWIKLYTELSSRDDWRSLTFAERGLLVTIWIEYAQARGRLRVSSVLSSVPLRGHLRRALSGLTRLNDAGFIRLVDSKPLAQIKNLEEEKTSTFDSKELKGLLDDLTDRLGPMPMIGVA
jgi:hypothetical protein